MTQKYDAIAMTAAGGWVENENREVLWIYRLDHWDLPKGKLETGENIDQCTMGLHFIEHRSGCDQKQRGLHSICPRRSSGLDSLALDCSRGDFLNGVITAGQS